MLALMTLFVFACSATPQTESTGQFLDSSAITAKVKASLFNELGSSGFNVRVETYKDVVQLSGFVDNQRVRQRAAIIASGVDGVRAVRNAIIVKSL